MVSIDYLPRSELCNGMIVVDFVENNMATIMMIQTISPSNTQRGIVRIAT
jgi:hypothetical protein